MRRVLNGYRYDTDSAEEIATLQCGDPSELHGWRETLYRNRRGAYFVAGEGGPLTTWSKMVDRTGARAPGAGIRRLTEEQAQEWLAELERG